MSLYTLQIQLFAWIVLAFHSSHSLNQIVLAHLLPLPVDHNLSYSLCKLYGYDFHECYRTEVIGIVKHLRIASASKDLNLLSNS